MTPVADGAQFDLVLSVVDVGKSCAPLEGRAVYIWHCDKDGRYSLYDTDDSNYLRGVGVTDAKGEVRFTTIFPGCYAGRWPHIHFEVFASAEKAVSGDASLLISQFALPADACKSVYEGSEAYAASVTNLANSRPLEQDGIFADNTPEQVAAQTIKVTGDAAAGWKGTCDGGDCGVGGHRKRSSSRNCAAISPAEPDSGEERKCSHPRSLFDHRQSRHGSRISLRHPG